MITQRTAWAGVFFGECSSTVYWKLMTLFSYHPKGDGGRGNPVLLNSALKEIRELRRIFLLSWLHFQGLYFLIIQFRTVWEWRHGKRKNHRSKWLDVKGNSSGESRDGKWKCKTLRRQDMTYSKSKLRVQIQPRREEKRIMFNVSQFLFGGWPSSGVSFVLGSFSSQPCPSVCIWMIWK